MMAVGDGYGFNVATDGNRPLVTLHPAALASPSPQRRPPRKARPVPDRDRDKAARNLWLPRLAIPGMKLNNTNLGYGGKAFLAIDLKIGLTVAEDRH